MKYCSDCEMAADFLDYKGKGFCSGVLKKPVKNCPKEDVIALCFVKPSRMKSKERYLLKPTEALSIATLLVGSFEVWAKKNGVETKP
jgi:hypothetical protein